MKDPITFKQAQDGGIVNMVPHDAPLPEPRSAKDLLDWAEAIICNGVPMGHCKQDEWDRYVTDWRDAKHAAFPDGKPAPASVVEKGTEGEAAYKAAFAELYAKAVLVVGSCKGRVKHNDEVGHWRELDDVLRRYPTFDCVLSRHAAPLPTNGTCRKCERGVSLCACLMPEFGAAPLPGLSAGVDGVALIAAERVRQVQKEDWSDRHDDAHEEGDLRDAAECYLRELRYRPDREGKLGSPHEFWPWGNEWWKPTEDPVRQLVKAGALVAAEIDRLNRLSAASTDGRQGEKGV